MSGVLGKVQSFQSLGTVDGQGVRYVVFLQGCNLRCGCCHNPDTWRIDQSSTYSAEQIVERALRYKTYFGEKGGITLSGGEPVLQAEFCHAVFTLCHDAGINTCLDTSGSLLNDKIKALLAQTDRVLLDIKYTTEEYYQKYAGCSLTAPLSFLEYLNERNIPTTVRQVIIPTLNDDKENILRLKQIITAHPCVDKVELLPFRKLCEVKYEKLGLAFPFAHIPEPSPQKILELENLLK